MAKDYNPDIVSVVDEEGKEHIFEELDRIETDRGCYVALLPVYDDSEEVLEGEDEVLPLKVIEEDGETYLTMIEDDDEFEEVYQAFEERLSDLFFDDERTDSESEEDREYNKATLPWAINTVHINPTRFNRELSLRRRIADLPAFAGRREREPAGRHPPALVCRLLLPYPARRGLFFDCFLLFYIMYKRPQAAFFAG